MHSELREKFETDGYVVLEGFITEKEADELRNEANRLVKNMPDQEKRTVFSTVDSEKQQSKDRYFIDSGDKISYFFESGAIGANGELLVDPQQSLNKIGHALHELNDVFRKITLDERVKESCYQLGLLDPAVAQSMYIFKNPGVGSVVTPHQDATYLYTEPLNIVGFWIALEDATIENGCLWFARGSNRGGVHRRYIKNPDTTSDEPLIYTTPAPIYPTSNFTPVPVSKGTCILIHGQAVHHSEPNKSKQSRHAYTFHVIEQKNTTYSKDNWLQPPEGGAFLSVYKNE